jgi:hypothetical protein
MGQMLNNMYDMHWMRRIDWRCEFRMDCWLRAS